MLLFLLPALGGCCKLIYKQAEIKIRFEGYAFKPTDSIRVSYFNSDLLLIKKALYSLEPDQKLTIRVPQEYFPFSFATISNTRLAIQDTLKNFTVTTEKYSKHCTGFEQAKVSFSIRNKIYESSALIELTLKQ